MSPLLLIVLLGLHAAPVAGPHAGGLPAFSAPREIAAIPADRLQGSPVRLAWSPERKELYVRAVRTDRWGNERSWHYVLVLDGGRLEPVQREPAWVAPYWAWKSALSAPTLPAFKIDVESREQTVTAVRPDSAGSIGQAGGDPTGPGSEMGPQGTAIASYANQAQRVQTTTFRVKGELLGQFVNAPAIAGLTFGWAPARLGVIAFASRQGRLIVMDPDGRRQEIAGTRDVLLPAWSDDGRNLAWLQKKSKKTYVVMIADVR